VQNSKTKHPWRLAPRLDGLSVNRSPRFAAYLDTLPPEERRVIESAERAYLNKVQAPNSVHVAAARDFDEGQRGLPETSTNEDAMWTRRYPHIVDYAALVRR
jgi:hypothetical protein